MQVDGVNVESMEISVRGMVEIECAHCGTNDMRSVSFDVTSGDSLSPNDELRADAVREAESEGWKRTRVGVGRRSRNGGIVCPECAMNLPS